MDDDTRTRDALLAQRFVALADTLVDDYDVVDLLDRLVHAIVELLLVQRGDCSCSTTARSPSSWAPPASRPESSSASSCRAARATRIECVHTGAPVTVEDLASHDGWPRFSQVALSMGFEAVHALPLRLRGRSSEL